ncbi:unnamed protein product [Chrysoparadoxa australica]
MLSFSIIGLFLWFGLCAAFTVPGKVAVFGATGKTGSRIVKQLLDSEERVRVLAFVRDRERAREIFGDADLNAMELAYCDVTSDNTATIGAALRGCDAAICATGYSRGFPPDPLGSVKVDFAGTCKIIDACTDAKVPRFVLITSLLTNGLAAGQLANPQFLLLNALGGILASKLGAEKYLQGNAFLDYTIIRPGGLRGDGDSSAEEPIAYGGADSFFRGSITRDQVAQVAAGAVLTPASSNKVGEPVMLIHPFILSVSVAITPALCLVLPCRWWSWSRQRMLHILNLISPAS